MLARLVTVVAFLAAAVSAIHLNAPETVKRCDRMQIRAGGKGTVNVAVLERGKECGEALKQWLNVNSNTFNWTVDGRPGQYTLLVEETGSEAELYRDFTVEEGSNDCVEGSDDGASDPVNPDTPSSDDSDSDDLPANPNPSSSVTPPKDGAANVGSTPGSGDSEDQKDGGAGQTAVASVAAALLGAVAVSVALF